MDKENNCKQIIEKAVNDFNDRKVEVADEQKQHNRKLDVCFSSKKHDWETPLDLFCQFNKKYNFVLDVCANKENAKCDNYISLDDSSHINSLNENWLEWIVKFHGDFVTNKNCWMNPPYKNVYEWVEKAWNESLNNGLTVVCLLPARTDTKWWHEFIYNQYSGKFFDGVSVEFLKGRLKFVGAKHAAPFPSCIVIFNRDV